MNESKTDIVNFSSRFRPSPESVSVAIGNQVVDSFSHARNLGCITDRHLVMKEHVAAVCRSATIAIRRIGQIRQYLPTQASQALVHASITSRRDNNNSLFFGLSQNFISQLQRTQNTAASIVNKVPRKQDISKSLKQLHWLPVEKRILFKILVITEHPRKVPLIHREHDQHPPTLPVTSVIQQEAFSCSQGNLPHPWR
ncbi:uncharacterized protein LOC121427932 [Lytechinus variegatus]|uniref:uncharacterized protein LOC121427932 n=1 Tax=Lytechinus variegatus TaxID=7654 RepID=UPI001BB2BBCE|nr:uncharacterized protein LOC121427932 [Lytechinus variegatus]